MIESDPILLACVSLSRFDDASAEDEPAPDHQATSQERCRQEDREEAVEAGLASVGTGAAALGTGKWKTRAERKRARQTAINLARQVGGQFSEDTVVDGRERFVVWSEGNPIDAFPRLDGSPSPEDLQARVELRSFQGQLQDPPPTSP